MHFGISEGMVGGGGGVKIWKPSVVGYGYFLELPMVIRLFVKLLPDALTPQFNDFVLQSVRISKEKTSKDVSKNFEEF